MVRQLNGKLTRCSGDTIDDLLKHLHDVELPSNPPSLYIGRDSAHKAERALLASAAAQHAALSGVVGSASSFAEEDSGVELRIGMGEAGAASTSKRPRIAQEYPEHLGRSGVTGKAADGAAAKRREVDGDDADSFADFERRREIEAEAELTRAAAAKAKRTSVSSANSGDDDGWESG